MPSLRQRIHQVIDQLSDEDLTTVWPTLLELYWDYYLLKATYAAKQTPTPGDTLTREEALRIWPHV